MAKNLWRKTRKIEEAYLSWETDDGEYRILKAYQSRVNEKKNSDARWFMAVRSPMTFDSWEMRDSYVSHIMKKIPKELLQVLTQREQDEEGNGAGAPTDARALGI